MIDSSASKSTPPIIIVGAGPCGLIAALTLQKQSSKNAIPFLIIEKASASKSCSNVGSGFDIAPTAVKILRDRLNVPIEKAFDRYEGLLFCDQEGDAIRAVRYSELAGEESGEQYSANRSTMQTLLLDVLLGEQWSNDESSKATKNIFHTVDGNGTLRFSSSVKGYKTNEEDGTVTVTLNDETEIIGSALLGCDGIHSAVRHEMVKQSKNNVNKNDSGNENDENSDYDPFHFCHSSCWWGKTPIRSGSKLEKQIEKTQHYYNEEEGRASFVWTFGNSRSPGAFMGAPKNLGSSDAVYLWAMNIYADFPPSKNSNDLTRRGGYVLDEDDKTKLIEETLNGYGSMVKNIIASTPASSITNVGLFDRENLNLQYSDGLVALLGDAAHPQSPFMGQGVNMAIADAYVVASRIVKAVENAELQLEGGREVLSTAEWIKRAIRTYDSEERRMGVNKVIKGARFMTDLSLSSNWFVCTSWKLFAKYATNSMIFGDYERADQSNADLLKKLDEDCETV